MEDFVFYSPTKLYFGKDKELELSSILSSLNVKKVLLVIGGGSVKKTGLFDRVINQLQIAKVKYSLLEGIRANPLIESCYEGIKLAKKLKPDLILAVGGGSVIDVAKNISVGYFYEGDSFDFNLHKVSPTKALPIGVILTIAASGSELSNSCVISDDKRNIKMGFNSDIVRPIFAIENPKLTYTLPKEQTAYGIVDILMHTIERYFNPSSENQACDLFALSLVKSVIKSAEVLVNDPNNYEARANIMLMSSLSHNGLTNIGKKACLYVHQLEHCLSGLYPNVAHGAGLAVLFPCWAKYYYKYDLDKFATFAKEIFNIKSKNKEKAAYKGIKEFEKFLNMLNMPKNYKDLGIDNIDIEGLVKLFKGDNNRVVNHFGKDMDAEVAKNIFELAR